jgi:GAF domain-containing protein
MGSDSKVLGILYVDNLTATHSFADEDLEFLIAFGGLTAVAIENSQLSDRLRREAVVVSNFQRYFAPNLASQIAQQEGEVALGGTKRPVVVFFSDIRGFTPMDRGPAH